MFTAKPTRRNFPRVHRLLRGLAFEAEVREVAEGDRDPEYVEAGWREAFVVVTLGGNRSELYAIVKPGEKLDPTTLIVQSWVGAFDVVMRPGDALALGAAEALRRTRKVNAADAAWLSCSSAISRRREATSSSWMRTRTSVRRRWHRSRTALRYRRTMSRGYAAITSRFSRSRAISPYRSLASINGLICRIETW